MGGEHVRKEPDMTKGKTILAAAAQMTSEKGQEEENLKKILAAVDEASGHGARLIAFPEAMNNGYIFESPEEAHAMANAGHRKTPRQERLCLPASQSLACQEQTDSPEHGSL
jgi:predicted amidohydrolase